MYSSIEASILAGGKSSRMGEDKSLMEVNSVPIIQLVYEKLKLSFEKVTIITNSPECYGFIPCDKLSDIYKHIGPLAGIHSALMHSQSEKVFILPCDAPLVSNEIIHAMVEHSEINGNIYAIGGGFHQHLIGIFSKNLIPAIEKFIMDSQSVEKDAPKRPCSVGTLLKQNSFKTISFDTAKYQTEFLNLNNRQDFEQLRHLLMLP